MEGAIHVSGGTKPGPPKPGICPFVKKSEKNHKLSRNHQIFIVFAQKICPQTDFEFRNSNFQVPTANFGENMPKLQTKILIFLKTVSQSTEQPQRLGMY